MWKFKLIKDNTEWFCCKVTLIIVTAFEKHILDNSLLSTFSNMKELYSELAEREQASKFMCQNNKGHKTYLNGILLLLDTELNYSSFPKLKRILHNRKNIKLSCTILIFMYWKKRDCLATINIQVTLVGVYGCPLFGRKRSKISFIFLI